MRFLIIYQALLNLIKPKGYNPSSSIKVVYNQWLHKGYIWGWYSYEFYTKNQKDTSPYTLPRIKCDWEK